MSKAAKIWNVSNLRKARLYLQKNGLKDTWYAAAERIHDQKRERYTRKILSGEEIIRQQKQAEKLKQESSVCFSILVPAYETKPEYMEELLHSVAAQTYPEWELVLVDAGKTEGVRETVERFLQQFPQYRNQIRYQKLAQNKGISENSNEALPLLRGNYTGLLDHDDTLSPDALYEMARAIRHTGEDGREAVLLYSDEDKMNEDGSRYYEPHFKEEFNYDLILSNNYICHFLVVQTQLLQELKFCSLYDGAQDYDLILRVMEKIEKKRRQGQEAEIVHVADILYHWRCHSGSTADNPASKMYAYEAGRKAVADYCNRKGWKVFVHHEKHLGFYRLEYEREIFRVRPDIGAVGGKILKKGKIVSGAYRIDATVLFEGLDGHFSGYMHRAVLKQDVAALDIRCMLLRSELHPLLAETLQEELGGKHLLTKKSAETACFRDGNFSEVVLAAWKMGSLTDEQIRRISLALGEKLRKAGYLVLWDPERRLVLK